MRLIIILVMAIACAACGDKLASFSSAKLDKWSWLPASTKNDVEAQSIPADANVFYNIPADDPLKFKSDGWDNKIDTFGYIEPANKSSYSVTGGTLVSGLGQLQRKAKYGDWDIVFSDPERKVRAGWGHCLTSGEILMPRSVFADPPDHAFVQNSYAVETFGPHFVIIRLDPAKGHKLCFLQKGQSDMPTVSYVGSKAEVDGKVLERKLDGWYLGAKRLSL